LPHPGPLAAPAVPVRVVAASIAGTLKSIRRAIGSAGSPEADLKVGISRNPWGGKKRARQDARKVALEFDLNFDLNLDQDRRHRHRRVRHGGVVARENFRDHDSGNRQLARSWVLPTSRV